MAALLVVQANTLTVRTTRVWAACAALMTRVMSALVQPAQPVVRLPLLSRFARLPALSAPTEKYAMVERTS